MRLAHPGVEVRYLRIALVPALLAVIPPACGGYLSNSVTPAYANGVIGDSAIAASHDANAWIFLRDHVRQYSFIEDQYGRPLSIRSHRGQSSLVLVDSDTPLVIVDGARLLDFDVLMQMPLDAVRKIEIMGGGRGTALEGTNAGAGVIYIHTRFASPEPDSTDDSTTAAQTKAPDRVDGPALSRSSLRHHPAISYGLVGSQAAGL